MTAALAVLIIEGTPTYRTRWMVWCVMCVAVFPSIPERPGQQCPGEDSKSSLLGNLNFAFPPVSTVVFMSLRSSWGKGSVWCVVWSVVYSSLVVVQFQLLITLSFSLLPPPKLAHHLPWAILGLQTSQAQEIVPVWCVRWCCKVTILVRDAIKIFSQWTEDMAQPSGVSLQPPANWKNWWLLEVYFTRPCKTLLSVCFDGTFQ